MRFCSLLLILLITLVFAAGSAHALQRSLSGDVTLGVQEYTGKSSGFSQKATSLSQQYSVTLTQQDNIFNGRGGAYSLMAGYELNLLDPTYEVNGVRDPAINSINTSKLYYNGNILLAPGGLPFRLSLFARDTKRSTFTDSNTYQGFVTGNQSQADVSSYGHLIDPEIYSDISNGTQNSIGGTLLLGIRNGSYLGAYRDLLSQLPRLLIDYKQDTIKDLDSSFSKVNMRNRDLAFVSLNKKDNWLHLRMRDHTDFLDPANNTETKQVLIGTVDHLLTRQWINLTNWIKISGDLSLTIEDEVGYAPTEIYQLNILAVARRQDISSTFFPQFSRENDGRYREMNAEVPFTFSVDLSRDTHLQSRLIFEGREKSLFAGLEESNRDYWDKVNVGATDFTDFYLDSQLELQRSQRIIIKPRLEIESRKENDDADGLALRVGAELFSNSRLHQSYDWLGGYALTVTQSSHSRQAVDGSFVQNEVYGRVSKDLSRTLRVGARGSLEVGSGEGKNVLAFRIQTMTNGLTGGTNNSVNSVDSSYTGMLTKGHLNFHLDHQYQQVSNRLELDLEFFTAAEVTANRMSLTHTLFYKVQEHTLDWRSILYLGDDLESQATNQFDFVGVESGANTLSTSTWDTKVKYGYDPNRSFSLTLAGSASGERGDIGQVAYKVSEELSYRIFTRNGIVRRLAELSEEIGYEKATVTIDSRNDTVYGRFSAAYFPTRYLYTKIRSEIVRYLSSSTQQHISTGEVGLNFEKLSVFASYSQADKDRESELLPEIAERRWDVQVKKTF